MLGDMQNFPTPTQWHDAAMIMLGMIIGALCALAGCVLAELRKGKARQMRGGRSD